MSEETQAAGAAAPAASNMAAMFNLEDLPQIGLRQLIDAGVHFGHQTNRWNPKMAPYIYGARNGIHVIDLDQTVGLLRRALDSIANAVSRGGQVLFVGTKRQAQDVVIEEAKRAQQFHVTGRWLGGTLTNFRTIKHSIDRLRHLGQMEEDGSLDDLAKREALELRRERERLQKYFGGIEQLNGLPAVLFVVDPGVEHIAVREANRLNIPVVALTDTNCNPDLIDLLIPGNDDAIRSVRAITGLVADACLHGLARRREMMQSGGPESPSSGVKVEFARARRPLAPPRAPEAKEAEKA